MPVTIETIPFRGWPHCLRLANGTVELVVTLDVGPRVLSYTRGGGPNPLNIFDDQAGGTNEPRWKNRGGHRLWLAPEAPDFSYFPDNRPVAWTALGANGVRLRPPPETTTGFQKEIDLRLESEGARVTLTHRIIRTGDDRREAAPWALSVMAAGGVAIIPQPALGEHPRDLLPNRRIVVWPYTILSDARFRLGKNFITVRQDASLGPTKIGLPLAAGWAAYWLPGILFLKKFPWQAAGTYPDDGCNLEVFTNQRMLELESLGPLKMFRTGDAAELMEIWDLREDCSAAEAHDDDSLAAYFARNPA